MQILWLSKLMTGMTVLICNPCYTQRIFRLSYHNIHMSTGNQKFKKLHNSFIDRLFIDRASNCFTSSILFILILILIPWLGEL